jgi:hypothetical protein
MPNTKNFPVNDLEYYNDVAVCTLSTDNKRHVVINNITVYKSGKSFKITIYRTDQSEQMEWEKNNPVVGQDSVYLCDPPRDIPDGNGDVQIRIYMKPEWRQQDAVVKVTYTKS